MKIFFLKRYSFLKKLLYLSVSFVFAFSIVSTTITPAHASGSKILGDICKSDNDCISGATCDLDYFNSGGQAALGPSSEGVCVANGNAEGMSCESNAAGVCGSTLSCSPQANGNYACEPYNSYGIPVGGSATYVSPLCGQNQVAVLNSSTNLCYCAPTSVMLQTQDDPSCTKVVSAASALNQSPSSNPLQTPNSSQGSPTAPSPQSSSDSSGQVGLYNPLSAGTNLNTLVNDILQLVVKIGSIVIILMLVETGFEYVLARGESGKLQKLHKRLLFIVIGALILLGAEAIALGIQATVQALSTGN